MKVAVIGAGKMGLPLACRFADRGAEVIACDLRSSVVDAINAGSCPIDEVGVPEMLAAAVAAGRLRATTDTAAAVRESEVVVVIVPALLTPSRDVDMSALCSVSERVADALRPGMMVSFETTVPIGGTRKFLQPVLEKSGLTAGVDFDLVYSPERVKSQLVLAHLTSTPKIVGGVTPASAERGARFYGEFVGAPVINVGTMEAAEMVKVGGMVYRDVNIALANELARYAVAATVDLPAIIDAINTDGEAHLLKPGIGVGGHCTPVYPYFLIRDAERRNTPVTLASRARRVNESQVSDTMDRVERLSGPLAGRRALILGLAFRPRVKEYILSPAFELKDDLLARGAEVTIHDPLYDDDEIVAHGFVPARLETEPAPEILILQTAHPEYASLDFDQLARAGVKVVVDGRNLWSPAAVRKHGLQYIGIGRPDEGQQAGAPAIPIARPELGGEEAEVAAEVVRSGWILQGPEVASLEREFAAAVGAPYACAVSNGTAALHLALRAAGVGPGDEVVTVSHSFIATASAVRYCGAVPVFVDIDPGTFNIDPDRVSDAMSPRTRAILVVHQMGMPADLRRLVAFARRHGVPIVEDAACAAGSEILWNGVWERIGKPHGDIACFSFHPRKVITTGEGGMITTSNRAWDEQCRRWRQHGMEAPGGSDYAVLGYNYRMTDIQAAIGREQIKRLAEIVARRRALADNYERLLARVDGIDPPHEPAWARSNWQSYCVWLPEGVDRARVVDTLRAEGVSSKPGIVCAHLQPAYEREPWLRGTHDPLAVSQRAQGRTLLLPLYAQMTFEEQTRVADALARALQDAPEKAVPVTTGRAGRLAASR